MPHTRTTRALLGWAALLSALAWASAPGCTVDFASRGSCGDGQLDPGEECDDGALNSDTAPDACRTNCRRKSCGDGVVDELEDCDGANLGGASCTTVGSGLVGGELACDGCRFDTSGCTGCGNGYVEPGESCDGSNLGTETCASYAWLTDGVLLCTTACELDDSGCYECGNGTLEGPELCEPGNLGGLGCDSAGDYTDGVLACTSDCLALDDSHCFHCGNDVCDAERGENLQNCPADCECQPNDQQECACPGWENAVQICLEDYHWSACECAACDAATHDEDRDGLLDGCDNCPDVANDTQANADGDQLGDPCEATNDHPLLDRGVVFESFLSSPSGQDWDLDAHATWSTDQLLLDASGCGVDCVSNALWQQSFSGIQGVAARYTHNADGIGWTCVVMGYGSWKPWVSCCLERIASTPSDLQIWRYGLPSTWTKLAETPGVDTATPGTERRLFAVWDGTTFTCSFANSDGESAQVSTTNLQASYVQGQPGLRVYEERATFLSFSVVR